jgi:hypothetical protein
MVFGSGKRTNVIRTAGLAAVVFGLALASCSSVSSNTPRFDWLIPPPTDATLTIDSNPRGALASTSNGGTCQTPCELSVPVIEPFTVTFTLDGYLPQTFSIRPVPVEKSALIDQTPDRLEPNPVLAELKPAPPPPPEPPPVKRRQRP